MFETSTPSDIVYLTGVLRFEPFCISIGSYPIAGFIFADTMCLVKLYYKCT